MNTEDHLGLERDLRAIQAPFGLPILPVTDVSYYLYKSPVLGRLLLASDGEGVLIRSAYINKEGDEDAILRRLAQRISPRILRRKDMFEQPISELEEYLQGIRTSFDTPFDLRLATPFQKDVLTDVKLNVRYGRTATYSQIANHLRRPKARRAVGRALGANPVCVFIPCHRVVGAGSTLTGYAGGTQTKKALLELEGADI